MKQLGQNTASKMDIPQVLNSSQLWPRGLMYGSNRIARQHIYNPIPLAGPFNLNSKSDASDSKLEIIPAETTSMHIPKSIKS